MLLAIDIGNTNIHLGLWNGRSWQHQWRLRTNSEQTADEFGVMLMALLREFDVENLVRAVTFCSVVPWFTKTVSQVSQQYIGVQALQLTYQSDIGIELGQDSPAEVGADRIANAVAAHHLFPGSKIIIDMGTATKFEVVTDTGAFLGGVIAPGLRLSADALAGRAAQLRSVPLEAPPSMIGRNTVHAVQSGLILAYASMIDGVVGRLREELPAETVPVRVIGTGGNMNLVAEHTRVLDHVDPCLTLTGLRIVYERMRGESA
ncbi:MAG: type III pantothenate kinase [Anaerolineae bacterium]|nr:type III pantothenate kinase [Anaerolineae bacterium]